MVLQTLQLQQISSGNPNIITMGKASFWYGTKAAYTAISSKSNDRLYFLSSGAIYKGTTLIADKTDIKSGDSPTFGSWMQLVASSGDSVYLDANENMASLTGLAGDVNVAGLQIESSVYIQDHLYVEDEVYAMSYQQSSDRRLKNHVSEFRLSLDSLAGLPLARFTYKKDPDTLRVGTYAQEVQQILPEVVSSRADGILSIDYSALNTAVSLSLVQIVKDQERRLAALEAKP